MCGLQPTNEAAAEPRADLNFSPCEDPRPPPVTRHPPPATPRPPCAHPKPSMRPALPSPRRPTSLCATAGNPLPPYARPARFIRAQPRLPALSAKPCSHPTFVSAGPTTYTYGHLPPSESLCTPPHRLAAAPAEAPRIGPSGHPPHQPLCHRPLRIPPISPSAPHEELAHRVSHLAPPPSASPNGAPPRVAYSHGPATLGLTPPAPARTTLTLATTTLTPHPYPCPLLAT